MIDIEIDLGSVSLSFKKRKDDFKLTLFTKNAKVVQVLVVTAQEMIAIVSLNLLIEDKDREPSDEVLLSYYEALEDLLPRIKTPLRPVP